MFIVKLFILLRSDITDLFVRFDTDFIFTVKYGQGTVCDITTE